MTNTRAGISSAAEEQQQQLKEGPEEKRKRKNVAERKVKRFRLLDGVFLIQFALWDWLPAMAMAACCRNRPLNRALVRAFRAVKDNRNSISQARRSCLSGNCGAPVGFRGEASGFARFTTQEPKLWLSWPQSASGFRAFSSGGDPPHEKITMPALSPTMTQGNVATWKKKEGDQVAAGDVLCQIETDKATLDLEAMEDGFLAKILAQDGSKDLPVGTPLCIIVEDKDDIGKFANYSEDAASSAPPKSEAQEPAKASSSDSSSKTALPVSSSPAPDVPHENITMPALSPTMTQGNVVKWKKNVGDKISAGDVLCEIETDKATLDMEAMEDGYLAKILVPAGTKDIPVGQSLCVVVEDEGDVGKFENYTGGQPAEAAPKTDIAGDAAPESSHESESGPKKSRVGPSVRRYLAESGLDAASLQGSGPHGMILKGDVLKAMKTGPTKTKSSSASPTPSKPPASATSAAKSPALTSSSDLGYTDTPTTQIRKIIAQRLLESKMGTPHLYLSADAILDPTLALRKSLKEKQGISVSVNDFVIRAAALALKSVPEANAFWDEKAGDILPNQSVDISIAVATDKGLITPIVKSADQKSLSEISVEVKSLAEKARTGKLKPHEFQGGTFSISNLGMFPVDNFCAVINPPQACILAVGRGEKHVIWEEVGEGAGRPVTVTKMSVTLSADHRVVDGDIASRFLKALTSNLSDPANMLL
ncbi:hypothetical protein R1flu_021742 [Riccia fluitans]|uniref:Acetyltransferase component of pyruvate dehydrogenase complex n=1 Tax=Riccia fluitans TaxID=41844 RepID=A0ABD1ZTE4_9MARC